MGCPGELLVGCEGKLFVVVPLVGCPGELLDSVPLVDWRVELLVGTGTDRLVVVDWAVLLAGAERLLVGGLFCDYFIWD